MSKSGVVTWNDKALKKAIAADVMERMEEAGGYLEGQARNNLQAIRDPPEWRKYRWGIAYKALTHIVETKGNTITCQVGMSKVFDGIVGNNWGFYIEVGRPGKPPIKRSRGYPALSPHPWLRPALLTHLEDIKAILGVR